jgi:uncharacterized protein YjdB
MSRMGRTLAATLALASWSCSGSTSPDAASQVAAIVVSPSSSTLALNAQLPLQALAQDGSGALVPLSSVTWTVHDPNVANVSAEGVVTALALGTTQVAASAYGQSGYATITVTKVPVASVVVLPETVDAGIGSKTQLTATTYDASNNILTDRAVIWASSNQAVATVSTSGLVTAVAPGTAQITGASEGKSDASVVTVRPGAVATVSVTPNSVTMSTGTTTALSATAKDASGTVIIGKSATWSSSNLNVATVSDGGLVSAKAPGNATITATIDGVNGTSAVAVKNAQVKSVSVSPESVSLNVGGTSQLAVTVIDDNNNTITDPAVNWTSSKTQFAIVSSSGLVTALLPGTSTIKATSGGVSGTASVTVNQPLAPVATITISPSAPSIVQNATRTLTATTKDANGNTLSDRAVTWTTSDASVASISSTSGYSITVTGGVAGKANVVATSEGKSATAEVTVTLGTVNRVTLTLQSTTLKKGQQTSASAVVSDRDGKPLQGRTVTWKATGAATISPSSSTTSVGSNSTATATVTAKNVSSTSTATITATSGDRSDATTLTVTP